MLRLAASAGGNDNRDNPADLPDYFLTLYASKTSGQNQCRDLCIAT
ncbi:hypothetical protein ALIPUT_01403 [Alistipes putredinis DSM 17216]|uniref:Uncharacterized protein n=1 Tax=Alistipes putredinis DSM 17216 TaxID=445970 RepID=B0MW96_9BACT|nr:hypothetical protein ALIPUT_01403 [Alistipes putredinis DSM 17216]